LDVPFVDLTRENDDLAGELEGVFTRVMRGGNFILGHEVASFEEEFSSFC